MSDIDFQNGFINGFVSGSTNIEVDMVNRRDTEANWQLINPIVANGEQIIVDTTNGIKIKIGDGVNHFNDLEYVDKPITDILSQKADRNEIPTALPAAGGNANTVGGKSADDIENAAKAYADAAAQEVKDDLTNHSAEAYDTLKELGELIDDNKDALEALNTVAIGKADKVHLHEISDVNGLSAKFDGIEGKIPTSNSQLTNDSGYISTIDLNNAINNIEIGGRNLFLKTNTVYTNNEYMPAVYIPANEPLVAGEIYTISICVTPAANVTSYGVYFSSGTSHVARMYLNGSNKQILTMSFTMNYSSGKTPSDNIDHARLRLYRFPNNGSVTDNSTIHWIKVEKGSKATDWTPAPEDMATAAQLSETNESIQQLSSDFSEQLSETNESIQQLSSDFSEHVNDSRLTGSASGDLITLDDSSDGNIIDLKISGKITQENKPGKNLLENKLNAEKLVPLTCTVQSDKSIVLNGTHYGITSYTVGTFDAKNGQTYALNGCPNTGGKCWFRVDYANGTPYYVSSTDTGAGLTFTCDGDVKLAVAFVVDNGAVFNNHVLAPMVRLASDTDATYEQHALSPHPLNPAPLVGVGDSGSFDVEVYGKNLLNVAQTVTVNKNYVFKELPMTLSAGNYVFSCTSSVSQSRSMQFTVWKEDLSDTLYNQVFSADANTRVELPFTLESAETVLLYFYANVNNVTITNCQMEVGTIATDYEPYKPKQTLSLPYHLRGVGDVRDEIDFERGMYIPKIEKVMYDGSDDEQWAISGIQTQDGITRFDIVDSSRPRSREYTSVICDTFKTASSPNVGNDVCWCNNAMSYLEFRIATSRFSTVSELKAWLKENPITMQYEMLTSNEVPLTEQVLIEYAKLRTNNPNTTIIAEGSPEMYVEYFRNTEDSEALIKHTDRTPVIREIYTPYGSYKPYYSAGDSINITTAVSGVIGSNLRDVWFTLSLPKPIVGNPTVTVSSIDGLLVRQAGKTCYVTGYTFVKPNSYSVEGTSVESGNIYIGATMPNTTNVTSGDDTCWVNVRIIITFS